MKAHIAIGANFGDEGKGQTVDYLCRQFDNCIVVRHNGGAQAAHTVQLEDGTRHVFHHFGSGTLVGAPTYLSKHFIVNPRAFAEEAYELADLNLGLIPTVYCHMDALLTTPYDWYINWLLEEERGEDKHGSCGMGINETVVRCETEEYRTTFSDVFDLELLRVKLDKIAEYVQKRMDLLKIEVTPHEIDVFSEQNIEQFLSDCELMKDVVTWAGDPLLLHFENVIFEGAQGLLLDERHWFFPHVTRSKTGSDNAVDILKGLGITHADIYYVIRSYLTRHGAGPLPHEGEIEPLYDTTNIPNEHQGALRFAPLNIDLMVESIYEDLKKDIILTPRLVVTWAHLATNNYDLPFVHFGEVTKGNILSAINSRIRFTETILFDTPTAIPLYSYTNNSIVC